MTIDDWVPGSEPTWEPIAGGMSQDKGTGEGVAAPVPTLEGGRMDGGEGAWGVEGESGKGWTLWVHVV